jgi:hypothetical protein
MSVRSSILANIETVLKAVDGVADASVFAGKLRDFDLDSLPAGVTLPLVFAIQGPEQRAEQVHGFETWNWTVAVEVWCADTAVETLYAAIHTAMIADITRGGYARKTERIGGDVLPIDPGRGISAFQQTYQIQYRHPWGTP